MRSKGLASLAFLIMIFCSILPANGQTNEKEKDTVSVGAKAISIGEISDESERLGQRLIKLKKVLAKSSRVQEVDSILQVTTLELQERQDSAMLAHELVSLRELRSRKVFWNNYKAILKTYQSIVKDRTEEISKITTELFYEIERWEETKEALEERSESKEAYASLDQVVTTLEDVMSLAHKRLDSVFLVQKNLTDLVLTVDEKISEIDVVQLQRQKEYFVFDSPPIWKKGRVGEKLQDSLSAEIPGNKYLVVQGVKNNAKQLVEYMDLHIKTLIFQISFLLLLFAFLFVVNRRWTKPIEQIRNPVEKQAKLVLANPILTVMSLGVLTTAFFYERMVPAFSELHILIVLIGATFLLPRITGMHLTRFMLSLLTVYILMTIEDYIGPRSQLVRWLMFFDAIVLFFALRYARKELRNYEDKYPKFSYTYRRFSILFMVFAIIAVIANIIGMVGLSRFIIRGVLVSVSLGMVVFVSIRALSSLLVLIFKLRAKTNINTLSVMVKATHQRIQPILNYIGFGFWIFFTLTGFELYDFLVEWVNEMMSINWRVGEMTISLGGILAFLMIFVITMIIAKLASAIFQDEWMVNVLPRGVAPAISLVLRILVVALGLYAGLTAAGVDLTKLGFILGALGVGIGFGLQNVVLNFVSGLILAFERPINLGDAIEVDMEKGVVTNIGVRSSNIRTYSGAEVIIPNGDLISKKVINYTLSDRNRRSKIPMKAAPSADPEAVIELFNDIAANHPKTSRTPEPKTYFYGYGPDGNLNFALLYWTTFSDTLKTDSEIALAIFKTLREKGIEAPAPVRRIVHERGSSD